MEGIEVGVCIILGMSKGISGFPVFSKGPTHSPLTRLLEMVSFAVDCYIHPLTVRWPLIAGRYTGDEI
jgi:hypothetical protein